MDTRNAFIRLSAPIARSHSILYCLCSVLIGMLLVCSSASSEARLSAAKNEMAVSTAQDGQFLPWVVADGEGGVIVMWEDYRTGKDWDVYAQRVDHTGTAVWEADGIPLCRADRNQRRLRTVRHETHAIVVWNDRRDGTSWDIYAQAVNLAGEVLWQTDGVPVCTNAAAQSTQAILSDGAGGVICVWEDERRSSEFQDIYIQRIGPMGQPMWERDGIPIFPSESLQSEPILVADGIGGFYVVWWDVIGYDAWHIMAYRLSFDGKPLWDTPRLVSPQDGMQGEPRVIADGEGGIIVLWQVYENFINDELYAQRIAPEGIKLWGEKGIALCTAPGIQKHASVVSDGSGGFIAVWRDERDIYADLYMQRIRADGTAVWEKDGIPLCTAGGHQDKPFIVRTEANRFFVAWLDYREDFGEESSDALYGQQIDIDGNVLWEENGSAISIREGKHYPPFVVSVGDGHWVVVWSNTQRDNGDIYLKRF